MLLSKWIAKNCTYRELSQALGVTERIVWHWVKGRATPRPKTIAKILDLTKGQVTIEEIYRESAGLKPKRYPVVRP